MSSTTTQPTPTTSDWKATAKDKRDSINAAIPQEWRINAPPPDQQIDVTGDFIRQFLSKDEIAITESDAPTIVQHTSNGSWTALEVARAFCHRAALAHQLTNCLHEVFFPVALQQAQALDDYYKLNGRPMGPLHGLPVSLKDQFHVRGVETTMGYVGWVGTFQGTKDDPRAKTYESEMVRELRELGAVLYCKTSVPHTLMAGETVNNIIEYTWNPKNRNLSCGGSSGGEGALIGLRGSPVGFGTDIGGSIRIPAAFNGLYGLRPTFGRLPYEGMANSMDGQNSVLSVVGPLATTPSALRLVTQSILSTRPWLHDPLVHEMPWRPENALVPQRKLTFGLLANDGAVTPHPPVARAIRTVVDKLTALGHGVIPWTPDVPHKTLLDITYSVWSFDGGADVSRDFALSGEPPAKQVMVEHADPKDAIFIMKTNIAKRGAQKRYMEYWNSTASLTGTGEPIDAIISPVAPFAAARPMGYKYYGYTVWVNCLDYSAVVVPVTVADKNVDKADPDFKPQNDLDADIMRDYDEDVYHGAHVAIQLVGRRFQEEKMIALAEYMEAVLRP